MDDLISRQAAIDAVCMEWCNVKHQNCKHLDEVEKDNLYWCDGCETVLRTLPNLPSVQPERLTDDDFETIRIHLNAQKEELCNQHRWKEAEEYQRIIDRFMAFASAQPERKKGKWIITDIDIINRVWHCNCSECGEDPLHFISGTEDWWLNKLPNYCPNCGVEMEKNDVGSKM